MKPQTEVRVLVIPPDKDEYVEIGCHKPDRDVKEIVDYIKSRQGCVAGTDDDREYSIPIPSVYYVETVDGKTFVYCADRTYQSAQKLYELEEVLVKGFFVRISKSVILNLMKVKSIRPALNGRYSCLLANGEEVIISRKYVADVKAKLRGEN